MNYAWMRLVFAGAVALSGFAVAADEFPVEWMLLRGSARGRLVERLSASGRTNEVALLEALAADDSAGTERAMRRLVDQNDDQQLGDALVRLLNASGRTAEAQELSRTLQARRAPRRKLMAAAPTAEQEPVFSGKSPVVFLHGYKGNAGTWNDFSREFLNSSTGGYGNGDIIVFQYYDDADNSSGVTRGLTTFGYTVDTKISDIARRVEESVTIWLRRRMGLADNDASRDAELPAADWVCHSMGGLVFRNVLRDRPELVRRAVTLGTPHFGQFVGSNDLIAKIIGTQPQEMYFGSSMLWNLAADWHFLGKRTDDILFVAGAADKSDTGIYHDGLVDSFSATMQTVEDESFARNTYFVMRIHSDALNILYDGLPALTAISESDNQVFRLVHGYLNDSGDFANGGRPSQKDIFEDDGCPEADKCIKEIVSRGALFLQVMDGVTNTAARLERPVEYDPGWFYADKIVESLTFGGKTCDGLKRASGSSDEGCTNGVVLLYDDIPTGDCTARIGHPYKSSRPDYDDAFHVAGGGVTIVRTRLGAARPMSAVPVADAEGKTNSVVVANDWLAAKGLAGSSEDLGSCVTAAAADGANGYPVAASYVLGLDPSIADSTLKITSFVIGDDKLSFGVSAGEQTLEAGEKPVVLQAADTLDGGSWRTVNTVPGSWTLPRSSGRFFRAALGW